jgi:outer membrane protein TolC
MSLLFVLLAALEVKATSQPASGPTMHLKVQDVLDRIERFDPSVKVKAYEQVRAEVLQRRAEWNRVSGNLGVNAQYGVYVTEIAPSIASASANQAFDRLTANVSAQLTVPLYAGYSIQGAINAARSRTDAAKYDRRAVTRDLKRAALAAFSNLIASEHQTTIAERALGRSEALTDIAERRKSSGISTEADVARAALNRLRRAEDVELRRGERAIAEAMLRAALVLDDDVHLIPDGEMDEVRTVGPKTVTEERLEVMSLRSQVSAALSDRKVAFAGWLPRLEAFGSASYGNGNPFFIGGVALDLGSATQRFGIFSGTAQAGLRVSWTGWDFFVTRDNVARAEAERSIAEMRLAEQERTVGRERGEAVARGEAAERRLLALSGSREVADKALRLAKIRYETGNALLTEVLDAELEAIAVESRKVQADYDAAVAHLDRLRAEGAEL